MFPSMYDTANCKSRGFLLRSLIWASDTAASMLNAGHALAGHSAAATVGDPRAGCRRCCPPCPIIGSRSAHHSWSWSGVVSSSSCWPQIRHRRAWTLAIWGFIFDPTFFVCASSFPVSVISTKKPCMTDGLQSFVAPNTFVISFDYFHSYEPNIKNYIFHTDYLVLLL